MMRVVSRLFERIFGNERSAVRSCRFSGRRDRAEAEREYEWELAVAKEQARQSRLHEAVMDRPDRLLGVKRPGQSRYRFQATMSMTDMRAPQTSLFEKRVPLGSTWSGPRI
jgi:hypothetical protein